jgi:hypothetical protein
MDAGTYVVVRKINDGGSCLRLKSCSIRSAVVISIGSLSGELSTLSASRRLR